LVSLQYLNEILVIGDLYEEASEVLFHMWRQFNTLLQLLDL